SRLEEHYQDYLPTDAESIDRWERAQRPVIRRAARAIDALAPAPRAGAPRRLLEIGSGFGFFLRAMQERGFEVRGLELSATGRRVARARFGYDDSVLADAPLEHAAFADASFDVVAAFYLIEHVPDPRALLREIGRVLAPGGLVFLRWPHTTPLARALDLFA